MSSSESKKKGNSDSDSDIFSSDKQKTPPNTEAAIISSDDDFNDNSQKETITVDEADVTIPIPDNSVVVLDGESYVIYSNLEYVSKLVNDWGFDDELVQSLKDKIIDVDALKFMTLADVDILIPCEKLGTRIKFRQKLLEWRLQNVSIFDFFQ